MNKKAIEERGWGPLNRNLLLYKEVQSTMTNAEREQFSSYLHSNPPVVSVDIFQHDSSSAVSDLSNVSSKFVYHQNQHQKVITPMEIPLI